ncbi:DUF6988 family protein [Pseudomonas sp.]|uniref:DUF6988 family protein n=1 Tax=Pseudomonas sp. TaxID=306 RepID=UPI003D09F2F2
MDMNQLLARSAELEARIASFLGLPLFDNSSRLRAVRSVASLGFEHAQSLKYLTAAGLCTSASALLRVQYESLVRAIWLHHCATNQDVELMLAELTHETAKQASKMPMLSRMLDEIEAKASHVPVASLREFKHYSWKPLSSYVHGGIHAVRRHGRGFPVELAVMQIRQSNGLLGLAGNLLLIIAGIPAEAGVMAGIYKEFTDCLPPAEPPCPKTIEPAH